MSDYARPELLCDTEWLQKHLDDPDLRIIDCGMPDAYLRVHLPGAVGLEHPYLKGREDRLHVMPAAELEEVMASRGISNRSTVVLYDDNASLHAARVWWVLERYGHTDVRVLNGGFNRWLHEGRPLTSQIPHPPAAVFKATPRDDVLCTIEGMRASVGGAGVVLWDVRSPEEWSGENDRGNPRKGHAPGAVHLEWRNLMEGPPNRGFKPPDELRRMVAALGITPEKRVVTY